MRSAGRTLSRPAEPAIPRRSAKNASSTDAKVTAEANRAAKAAVANVDVRLRQDSAAATNVLHQLQTEAAAARRSRDALIRDLSHNQTGVVRNARDIAALQNDVTTLTAEVHKLTATVTAQGTEQQTLAKQVAALEKKVKP